MIQFSETLALSQLDDEIVLLDSRSGKYFGLNAVGSRMFTLLKETGNLTTTWEQLVTEYQVPADRIKTDLLDLLRKLKEKGLVQTDEV
jgi:hypothetical protein